MARFKINVFVGAGIGLAIILIAGIVFVQKYPFGVKKYKTIEIGMDAAEKAGDSIGWASPDDTVMESKFYVYSLGDETMCINSSCGAGAYFVVKEFQSFLLRRVKARRMWFARSVLPEGCGCAAGRRGNFVKNCL